MPLTHLQTGPSTTVARCTGAELGHATVPEAEACHISYAVGDRTGLNAGEEDGYMTCLVVNVASNAIERSSKTTSTHTSTSEDEDALLDSDTG